MGMNTAGLIVAAGLSSRMGAFKPCLPLGGKSIIEASVASMVNAGIKDIVLVLGHFGQRIEKLFEGNESCCISFVYNENYRFSDMMESIQIGLKQIDLTKYDGVFILPGDIPKIDVSTYRSLNKKMEETGCLVALPLIEGKPKHPPLIHVSCIPRLLSFNRAGGLRVALKDFEANTTYCSVDDFGCTMDVDTPEQYEALINFHYK